MKTIISRLEQLMNINEKSYTSKLGNNSKNLTFSSNNAKGPIERYGKPIAVGLTCTPLVAGGLLTAARYIASPVRQCIHEPIRMEQIDNTQPDRISRQNDINRLIAQTSMESSLRDFQQYAPEELKDSSYKPDYCFMDMENQNRESGVYHAAFRNNYTNVLGQQRTIIALNKNRIGVLSDTTPLLAHEVGHVYRPIENRQNPDGSLTSEAIKKEGLSDMDALKTCRNMNSRFISLGVQVPRCNGLESAYQNGGLEGLEKNYENKFNQSRANYQKNNGNTTGQTSISSSIAHK